MGASNSTSWTPAGGFELKWSRLTLFLSSIDRFPTRWALWSLLTSFPGFPRGSSARDLDDLRVVQESVQDRRRARHISSSFPQYSNGRLLVISVDFTS